MEKTALIVGCGDDTGAAIARAFAQSMARDLGPKNIHVVHVVIDGAIDTIFTRGVLPNVDVLHEKDKILNPDDIGAANVMLHHHPRTAWPHELDLRL